MSALLLLAALAAQSGDSIFGLQLGQPIPLPECERMALRFPRPDGSPPPYTTVQARTCQMLPDRDLPNSGVVAFLPEQMPLIVSHNWVLTTVIDGRLEGLAANTLDYNNKSVIIAKLVEKFGPPTQKIETTETVEHIGVPVTELIWRKPNYTVTYSPIARNHLENGSLIITSRRAQALIDADERLDDAKKTPL